jgi:medium-chain acyl-[acyl-carrier-protein] hydrolase
MQQTVAPDRWVIRPRPDPSARLRLFCLPYAGGGASAYRTWPAHLPRDIEVAALQLPGREERLREPPFQDAAALAARLVHALQPWLDRPFALFGHSMGALVAFELARALRRAGGPAPVHLLVSARCGPRRRHRLPPVHRMTDADLVAQLRRLGKTPEEVLRDPELMRLVFPLFRADLTLCETYAYAPDEPLACPISAFGGALDEFVLREDLLAWSAETRGAFRARMFPGGHFFIHDAAPRLLQAIAEDLQGGRVHDVAAPGTPAAFVDPGVGRPKVPSAGTP